jgi:hypothetical protein
MSDPEYVQVKITDIPAEFIDEFSLLADKTPTPGSKPVEGTNTFFRNNYDDIPVAKRKKFCHTLVVCEVRSEKDDPDRARITIG